MKKKIVLGVTALALVLCFVIGGTLAWLKDQTEEVKNTFTYGDINITLDEADVNDEDGDGNTTERVKEQAKYKMIPGVTLTKDPTVTVKANSENCWLFVKVEKSDNFDSFMTYDIDVADGEDGWNSLGNGYPGVYYREVMTSDKDQSFSVLKDNQVTVLGTVTKVALNALDTNADGTKKVPTDYPTLSFTAYAVQKASFDSAVDAWAEILNPTDANN